jgi:hypothetical protein
LILSDKLFAHILGPLISYEILTSRVKLILRQLGGSPFENHGWLCFMDPGNSPFGRCVVWGYPIRGYASQPQALRIHSYRNARRLIASLQSFGRGLLSSAEACAHADPTSSFLFTTIVGSWPAAQPLHPPFGPSSADHRCFGNCRCEFSFWRTAMPTGQLWPA